MLEESMRFAKQNTFQSYKAPSCKRLSWELLDQAYKSTEQRAAPILAIAKEFGAKISSDRWSDAQRQPILNFTASTRAAAAFLKSIDCTDHMAEGGKKDAVYRHLYLGPCLSVMRLRSASRDGNLRCRSRTSSRGMLSTISNIILASSTCSQRQQPSASTYQPCTRAIPTPSWRSSATA